MPVHHLINNSTHLTLDEGHRLRLVPLVVVTTDCPCPNWEDTMATLFEILGEGTYVEMMKAVGLRPEPVQTHPYAKCTSPSRCAEHRRVYRRLLKAQRDAVIHVSKISVAETALRLLAEEAPALAEERCVDLAKVAKIDPNPTRLDTVTRGEALRTVARRALYVGGKA